jgi:hypothetical protein
MLELQRNSLANLKSTLMDLGSDEQQRRYKESVPFVHVPIELAAQCAAYTHQLGQAWYRKLFDADEVRALSGLFAMVRAYVQVDTVPDVDEGILDDPAWRSMMATARSLHERLVASGRIESP